MAAVVTIEARAGVKEANLVWQKHKEEVKGKPATQGEKEPRSQLSEKRTGKHAQEAHAVRTA